MHALVLLQNSSMWRFRKQPIEICLKKLQASIYIIHYSFLFIIINWRQFSSFFVHFVSLSDGSTKRLSNESHDISRDLCCLDMALTLHQISWRKDRNETINMFSNIPGLKFTSGGVNLEPSWKGMLKPTCILYKDDILMDQTVRNWVGQVGSKHNFKAQCPRV